MLNIRFNYQITISKENPKFGRVRVVVYQETQFNDRITVTMPINIAIKEWENRHKRKNKKSVEGTMLNSMVNKIETELSNYALECEVNGNKYSKEAAKNIINAIVGKKHEKKSSTPQLFTQAFNDFILSAEEGKRLTSKKTKIRAGTIKKYYEHLNHIKVFERKTGMQVMLSSLSKGFGDQLHTYFNNLNLGHNTKANILRTLFAVENYAVERDWTTKSDFCKVAVKDADSDAIALTEEEVNKIYYLNLTDSIELEEARDVFIVGIWTMMRYENYIAIKSYHIQANYVQFRTTKTDTEVIVPLHWQLQEILKKYNNELPRMPVNQVFNRYIKKIAQRAGLEKMIEKTRTVGGKPLTRLHKQHQLITSHTARRTGATLLYLDGVPKKQIMLLTGHSNEDVFDRYIRIGKYANAKLLSGREFFRKKKAIPKNASEFEDGYYLIEEAGHKSIVETRGEEMYKNGCNMAYSINEHLNRGMKVIKPIDLNSL